MSAKIGLIGRVDDRGIGMQSWEFWRHMGRPRTLAVLMNDGWPQNLGRFGYDDVVFIDSNLSPQLHERWLDEDTCRQFLKGLDVVFAIETVYEWGFCDWAREMGVRVVIQSNPEMFGHYKHPFPQPDQWCWPTPWMVDQLPEGPILPVPCTIRPNVAARDDDDVLRVLHVAGKHAAGDRNGTYEFIEAIQAIRERVHVTIVTQDGSLPNEIRHGRTVSVTAVLNGVRDRWKMYEDHHVLVQPRKYGGLHLPALEAMSCGLCVVMPDCSPNEIWPGPRIPARMGRSVYAVFGRIEAKECHAMDIAAAIDDLALNREKLHDEMSAARDFAEANSWEALMPEYRKVLEG